MTTEWVDFVIDKLRNSGKNELASQQNILTKIVTVVDRTHVKLYFPGPENQRIIRLLNPSTEVLGMNA